MNIYQQELLDHYHHSPFKGKLEKADISSNEHNPSCGDSVAMQLNLEDGLVTKAAYTGSGCVISQAAASMLCREMIGKSLTYIHDLNSDFMLAMLAIQLGPTRLKCALLALAAVKQGILAHTQGK